MSAKKAGNFPVVSRYFLDPIPGYDSLDSETDKFSVRGMSGVPTSFPDISRTRKTVVYQMSYAKKVLHICLIDLFCYSLIISIIQKKPLAIPK